MKLQLTRRFGKGNKLHAEREFYFQSCSIHSEREKRAIRLSEEWFNKVAVSVEVIVVKRMNIRKRGVWIRAAK